MVAGWGGPCVCVLVLVLVWRGGGRSVAVVQQALYVHLHTGLLLLILYPYHMVVADPMLLRMCCCWAQSVTLVTFNTQHARPRSK